MSSVSYKRYMVTSALPYANGPKHIGHLAGAYIPADVYVRYLRLNGKDVVFVSGSDEHGTAIPNQALKEAIRDNLGVRVNVVVKYHVRGDTINLLGFNNLFNDFKPADLSRF